MIACIAKNARAKQLFRELGLLDSRYVDAGLANVAYAALLKGAATSLSLDSRTIRMEARRSPAAARSLAESCQQLLDGLPEEPEAVLYWGATNWPFDPEKTRMPYFLITDGPFDPGDPSYPIEWVPRRWPKGYFQLQHDLLQGAVHTFTLSEWARHKVLNLHGLTEDRVTRIGWGPIGMYGAPVLELPQGFGYFLALGAEWHRKGFDLVAEAGARVHRRHRDTMTFLVGKPEGSIPPKMEGVIQMPYGVPGPAAHTLIKNSLALVIASRFDASPHVIFEALQYGTPVIGSKVCGIPEAIDAPRGGHVVEPGNADAIEAAMEHVLAADPHSLRSSSLEVYRRSGGWTRSAQIIHDIIKRSI